MPVARAARREAEFNHDWQKKVGWKAELKIDFDLLARRQQEKLPQTDCQNSSQSATKDDLER